VADERDHDRPVHRGGGAADQHEPGDAAADRVPGPAPSGRAHARTLCLVVDDLGLHRGVDDAAWRLIEMGRVHAVGCMVGGPAWRDGQVRLRGLDPRSVDVGLHLDLTEHPLGGAFRLGGLIAACLMRRIDPLRVGAEIRAQLDAFEAALGRPPAFVDGHQHVHQLPGVRQALFAELARRPGPGRPWLRSCRAPAAAGPGAGWRDRIKAGIVAALGARALERQADRLGWRHNARLLGVYDFRGGPADYLRRLEAWLRAGAATDLLMCHPSAALGAGDPIAQARAVEFTVLAGDAFGALLRRHDIVLQPLSRTLAEHAPP
jgi:predicted glycoside hydrolase/deacetylase ChbG (UPF0249 family)